MWPLLFVRALSASCAELSLRLTTYFPGTNSYPKSDICSAVARNGLFMVTNPTVSRTGFVCESQSFAGGTWAGISVDFPLRFYSACIKVRAEGETKMTSQLVGAGPFEMSPEMWTPNACREPNSGDINGDGKVGCWDLAAVVASFGRSGSNQPADVNEDGKVSLADMSIVLSQWDTDNDGGVCPPSQQVPPG